MTPSQSTWCSFCGAAVGEISERTGMEAEAMYECPRCMGNYCDQCSGTKDRPKGTAICLACHSEMKRTA